MQKPTSVSELLAKRKGTLERLVKGGQAADQTLSVCREILPAAIAEHVWGAAQKGADLTLFVDSPAWATRARYAAAELREPLGARLGAALGKVTVRVRPRS